MTRGKRIFRFQAQEWCLGSGSEDPLPADHNWLLQFDGYEIENRTGGKNSPITSTDPSFLRRSQNNHMNSVMKMRDLSFIYMYVSTYEVETVFNDRCVILGNVETTNILGLVSELYRTNHFISETESLFSMKTQIVEEWWLTYEDVSDSCSCLIILRKK